MAKTNSTGSKKSTAAQVVEENAEAEIIVKEKFKPTEIDLNQYIPVRNGFQGRLVYISRKTHEKFVWEEFGDVQDMELIELRNAKSSAKRFFTDNWFVFDKDYQWVIDYLGLKNYYQYSLDIDNFDELYKKSPSEINKTIAKLSNGQKKSVAYRARQLIADGAIDSNKAIAALEEALGENLIDHTI